MKLVIKFNKNSNETAIFMLFNLNLATPDIYSNYLLIILPHINLRKMCIQLFITTYLFKQIF